MKICPQCQKQYEDEMLFCLDDGKSLVPMKTPITPTVSLTPSHSPPEINNPFTPNWQTTQPQKKSKVWIWILTIVLGIMLLCGGGLIGFLALIAITSPNDGTNVNTNVKANYEKDYSPKFPNVMRDDFSTWEPLQKAQGVDVIYSDGELFITAKPGYFYVLVTPKNNFRTENSSTRVMVRNTTGELADYGYGLLIHADQKNPLQQGYIFAIETSTQMYKVWKLQEGKIIDIENWTQSNAIKTGADSNLLEVVDEDSKMSFYVNGKFLTEYKDNAGIRSGFVGLYTSDSVPVAFSNLEIRRR